MSLFDPRILFPGFRAGRLAHRIQIVELDWETDKPIPLNKHHVYRYNHAQSGVWLCSQGGVFLDWGLDPEAVLTVHDTGKDLEFEVARLSWAAIQVILDGELLVEMPRVEEGGLHLGYFAREHVPY